MNLACRVDTVHLRQRNVNDNDVWLPGQGLRDRLDAIGRLAHDLELRMFAEQFAQPGACYSVIVSDKNTQLRCATRGVIDQTFLPSRVILWCFGIVGGTTRQTARQSQGES